MKTVAILLFVTILCLIVSFIADRAKTLNGLKRALKMFINLLIPLTSVLAFVSILLFFAPSDTLAKWFGESSGIRGMIIAAVAGSIFLIPGFIAYPLGSILIKAGVSYSVIAIFITTLMMVGIVTLPIEKKFFGLKTAILRNSLSFIGALIIGILIGLLWSIA